MKIALAGLPGAGRKTLFALLTGRRVPEGPRPGESVAAAAPTRDPRVDPARDGDDSAAPVAGGRVHSDIERGFIRAGIIEPDDHLAAGSEAAARA